MMSTDDDTVAVLMSNIASPNVVSQIDEAIEAIERQRQELDQQRLELVELRKMAVRRHGESAVEPQSNRKQEGPALAFTLADLIRRYRTDMDSSYHQLRFATRERYEVLLRQIERNFGAEKVAEIGEERLRSFWNVWSDRGTRVASARTVVAVLRTMVTHGATKLKSRDCRELKLTLHDMRFALPNRPEGAPLTQEQADAIRAKAHEMGRPSIALAQAFQFEGPLRQKDVIGEWVPLAEPEESHVINDDKKWVRGLRWEEIDDKFVLHHTASMNSAQLTISLRDKPMVMEELRRRVGLPESADIPRSALPPNGPIVTWEYAEGKIPWTDFEFRRWWRILADACDVPKQVKNKYRSRH